VQTTATQPSVGRPADWFTAAVSIDPRVARHDESTFSVAAVRWRARLLVPAGEEVGDPGPLRSAGGSAAVDATGRQRRVVELGGRSRTVVGVTPEEIADLVCLRRARDLIDRSYAQPLDVPAMARAALMSPAHFSRKFRAAYGETPYSYLMTRRIERAKALLRQGVSVTDTCFAVGCTSLGSFSSRFTEIVGETPSQYRARDHRDLEVVPSCVSMIGTRPRRATVSV
jgi:AraC-like DNA-binding protein